MLLKELPFHALVGPFNPPAILEQRWYISCLSDPRCLGDYLHHSHIHPFFTASDVFLHSIVPGAYPQAEAAFKGPRLRPGADYYLQPMIDESRHQHPVDVVIWWGFQNGFPLDLGHIDVPVFVVMSDWHNDKPLARLLQTVDGIFCDEKLRQRLIQQHSGFKNKVKYWPAYSFDSSMIASVKAQPEAERDIDVLFVGNTNPHKYLKRNQFLFRIANLPDINFHLACGIFESEHLALLQRSKIAFNHTLRQEMNLRAYEATACGALLLMESDNLEVNQFLQPNVSYVPYTPHNLEAQIQYYLAHPEERERIAQQGKIAIQPRHYTIRFGELLEALKSELTPDGFRFGGSRRDNETDDVLLAHALLHMTTDLSVLRVHVAHQLAQRSHQLCFANALLVTLADLFVHPVTHEAPTSSLQEIQESLEKELASPQHPFVPLHMLIAYNLAWSYFFQADYTEVERALQCFLKLIDRFSWLAFSQEVASSFFVLPVRYTGFYLLYQETAAVGSKDLQQVLMAGVAFLQGCVQRSQNKNVEAVASFEQCIGLTPGLVEAYFELAGAWIEQGEYMRAEQCLAQGLYQGIFFKGAWKKYFELLDCRALSRAEQDQKSRLIQALQNLSLD